MEHQLALQLVPTWITHLARFCRSSQRCMLCWQVRGTAHKGCTSHLASAAGVPASQRQLNPGIGFALVVKSLEKFVKKSPRSSRSHVLTSLTCPGLAPGPYSQPETWICFPVLAGAGQLQAGGCSKRHFVFQSQTRSWCRYLGNKQSFCRPNISGLSLSWEQTVCCYSCKQTEDSYLVLQLQLTVI